MFAGCYTYVQHLKIYERHTVNAGLHKMHGLRHAYAQRRYEELTGRPAPAAGGATAKELSPARGRTFMKPQSATSV